jgi:hypothetical protein
MNNRSTMYMLMVLAALAFGGRFWSQKHLSNWEESVTRGQSRYKVIWETSDDLALRREKAPKGTDDQSFRKHFQAQAFGARMGNLDIKTDRPRQTRAGGEDRTFTIVFDEETGGAFTRAQLRYFLFNSELLFPRLRCTALSLSPNPPDRRSRGIDPGLDREDIWRVTKLQFKQRSPVVQKPGR